MSVLYYLVSFVFCVCKFCARPFSFFFLDNFFPHDSLVQQKKQLLKDLLLLEECGLLPSGVSYVCV